MKYKKTIHQRKKKRQVVKFTELAAKMGLKYTTAVAQYHSCKKEAVEAYSELLQERVEHAKDVERIMGGIVKGEAFINQTMGEK